MRSNYTNLPNIENKNKTLQEFQGYQNKKPSSDPSTYNSIIGFFTSRGFDVVASELIAEVVMTQAKTDGYSAMQILDSMRSLNEVELSGIMAEILNFNRYKSSSLGYLPPTIANSEITRNIIA